MEFLVFEQFDTATKVIPLIPLILGRRIRFWCWHYVSVIVCWGGGGGGHLDANSKMNAKNNEYTQVHIGLR